MERRNARGFGLLDMVLSFGLLALLSMAMVSVFAQTTSMYRLGTSRSGLQSEIRRIHVVMGRELAQSSFYTVSIHSPSPLTVPRDDTTSMQARRDSLSCATLISPLDPSSFDSNSGLPKWDRYVIYMASNEVPNGKLIRYAVNGPSPITDEQKEMTPPLSARVAAYPGGVITGTTRMITHRLVSFEVEQDLANQFVIVSLILRGDAGRLVGGRKTTAELLETKLSFRPENTWPRL